MIMGFDQGCHSVHFLPKVAELIRVKSGFCNPYINTETEYTKKDWFGLVWFWYTPIKTENTELLYPKNRKGKIPKNNTKNTNSKMTESRYTYQKNIIILPF